MWQRPVREFGSYPERELARLWAAQARTDRRHQAITWGSTYLLDGDLRRSTETDSDIDAECTDLVNRVGIRLSSAEIAITLGYPATAISAAMRRLHRAGKIVRLDPDSDEAAADPLRKYVSLGWTPEAELM